MEDFPLDSVLGMIWWNLANRVATTFALPMVHNKSVVLSLEHNLETWRCEAFAFFDNVVKLLAFSALKVKYRPSRFLSHEIVLLTASCELW